MGEEPTPLFRKKALDKLASPESLDERMTIVTIKSWLLLSGFYALLLCLLIWSIWGSIPEWVEGQGLLLYGNSHIYSASVTSGSGGAVTKLLIRPGDKVTKGQVIAIITQSSLVKQMQVAAKYLASVKTQYSALQAEAQQALTQHHQNTIIQEQHLNKVIAQMTIALTADEAMLRMSQELFKEGIEDKRTVVEALKAVQNSKNQIDAAKQEIAKNKNEELVFSEQWSERLEQLKNTVEDKQKNFEELQHQYKAGKYIRSPISGHIINVFVALGDFADSGKAVASVAPVGSGLDAVVFVPSEEGKLIKPGMPALVFPSTVKKNEYGGIYGKVVTASNYPTSDASMLSILQDTNLVKKFNEQGSSISVRVKLKPDASSYSGFTWSSSGGPKELITPGTLVTVKITVDKSRPITLLIPALRTLVEGT